MTTLFDSGYEPAPESSALARLDNTPKMFIAGDFVDASDGSTFDTVNPANNTVLAKVPSATATDVDAAVDAANAALPSWAALPSARRAELVFRLARLLAERSREFAVLESLDGGKPIRESRDFDVPTAAQHFFYHAGWADKLDLAGLDDTRPVGVVAQVVPWNFPLLMAAWKLAPALACGNTVVLKPAETTPLSALRLCELIDAAGFPAGVVNVICGAGDVGERLVTHDDVDKVAFTGSTAVGRRLAELAAGTHKRLTLELGGKSANIVFDDASLDTAVEGVVNAIFFNQGHVCCAGSRLLVQESLHDRFIERLVARMQHVRLGDPLDKNTDMGAVNSTAQLSRISSLVDAAKKSGIDVVHADVDVPDTGCWYPPTLLLGVDPADEVARTEIFGPVLSVMTFRTPQEAVDRANDSTYGLAAGVFTQDASKVRYVSSKLRAGVVWANTYNRFDPASPFGGFRESGFGREGGRVGLAAYTTPTSRSEPLLTASVVSHTDVFPPDPPSQLDVWVPKTYKLFIGGAFARSESGATYRVRHRGRVVEVPAASRKDARDAVAKAAAAGPGWAARTAYNRGQILYRVAEMCEDIDPGAASVWVHMAGFCDKVATLFGSVNDVDPSFESVSQTVPTGVSAVVVPPHASRAQFAHLVAAPLVAGNAVVVVIDEADVELLEFAEVFATSDVPSGVVNILTESPEVVATLAAHSAVNCVDLSGVAAAQRTDVERCAAQNLARTRIDGPRSTPRARIAAHLDVRTVWHPRSR